MLHGIRKTCSRICPSAKCSMMPFPLPAGPSGLEDVTKWMSSLCKFTGLCLGLWAMGYLQLCKHRGCRLTHDLTPTFFLLIYSQWCCACLASFLKLKRAKWSENVSIYSWYSARTSWLKGKQHINHEGRSGHSSHYLGHTVHTSQDTQFTLQAGKLLQFLLTWSVSLISGPSRSSSVIFGRSRSLSRSGSRSLVSVFLSCWISF